MYFFFPYCKVLWKFSFPRRRPILLEQQHYLQLGYSILEGVFVFTRDGSFFASRLLSKYGDGFFALRKAKRREATFRTISLCLFSPQLTPSERTMSLHDIFLRQISSQISGLEIPVIIIDKDDGTILTFNQAAQEQYTADLWMLLGEPADQLGCPKAGFGAERDILWIIEEEKKEPKEEPLEHVGSIRIPHINLSGATLLPLKKEEKKTEASLRLESEIECGHSSQSTFQPAGPSPIPPRRLSFNPDPQQRDDVDLTDEMLFDY